MDRFTSGNPTMIIPPNAYLLSITESPIYDGDIIHSHPHYSHPKLPVSPETGVLNQKQIEFSNMESSSIFLKSPSIPVASDAAI